MPNGYIGLYLIKVVHNTSACRKSDNMTAIDNTVTFLRLGVFKRQDRSKNQLSRKRNTCRRRKENQNKMPDFFTGIISLIIDIIDFKKLNSGRR